MKPTNCTFKPEEVIGPIGMFHCPECGSMELAGLPHSGILEDSDYNELDRLNTKQ